MSNLHGYRLSVGVYYLLLGVWIGAIGMSALAAGMIFHTVATYEPSLHAEPYNAPEFADRAPAILAGGVAGRVFEGLAVVQIVCAAGVVLCLVLQFTLFHDRMARRRHWANGLRVMLVTLPVAVLVADQLWVVPTMNQHLQATYDLDRPAAERQARRASFDALHQFNTRTTGAAMLMLAGALLVSPWALLPSGRVDNSPPS